MNMEFTQLFFLLKFMLRSYGSVIISRLDRLLMVLLKLSTVSIDYLELYFSNATFRAYTCG